MGRSSGGGGRIAGGGAAIAESGTALYGSTDHDVDFNMANYMAATGVSDVEATARFKAIEAFTESDYVSIRKSQRDGKDNEQAQKIEAYLASAKKYNGEIYRGVSLNSLDDFYTRYGGLNGVFRESSMNSWSSDVGTARVFAAKRPTKVLFRVQNKSGSSIRNKSSFFAEQEVLVGKGARYRISKLDIQETKGGGVSVLAQLTEL